jgi:glycine betaine/proline transport system permease protein
MAREEYGGMVALARPLTPLPGQYRTMGRPRLRAAPSRLTLAAGASLGGLLLFALTTRLPLLDQGPVAGQALPFGAWANALLHGLLSLTLPGGLTLMRAIRSLRPLLDAPIQGFEAVFANGLVSGYGDAAVQRLPPLSWAAVGLCVLLATARIGGLRPAAWAGGSFLYLQVFGLWADAVATLAQMALAVPASIMLGFAGGVFLARHPGARPTSLILLDQAQTVPLFAYLVPLVLFLGLGTAPAVCAIIIFAMPPMVRATLLALEESEARFGELAAILGCTPRQSLWRVLVPTAAPMLRLGINQVILLAFSTAILASLVGATGLGNDVLVALQQLAIGRGLVTGLAITALAISLDSLLQAATRRAGPSLTSHRHRLPGRMFWPLLLVILVGATALEPLCPALGHFPDALTVQRLTPVDNLVDWLVTVLYQPVAWLQWLVATCLLFPLKAAILHMPWAFLAVLLGGAGWRIGGPMRAATMALPLPMMALAGIWPPAQQTIYLTLSGSLFALLIGLPFGIVAARVPRLGRVMLAATDTLQTLPAFIYLIPVVMLLGSGDVASILAVALFAVCPAIRYTEVAVRTIPSELTEAAEQMGCTSLQYIRLVALPVARPRILLGISQTMLMALSMVVITALIGTTDLGQMTLTAVSQADPGSAAVAGLAIAALGTLADRLLTGFAGERRTT